MITQDNTTRPEGEAVASDTVKAPKAPETAAELFAAGRAAAEMYQTKRSTARSLLDHSLNQVADFARNEPFGGRGDRFGTRDEVKNEAAWKEAGVYDDATLALCNDAEPIVAALRSLKLCTDNGLNAADRREIDELLSDLEGLRKDLYRKEREDDQHRIQYGTIVGDDKARRASDTYQAYCGIFGDMATFLVRHQQ